MTTKLSDEARGALLRASFDGERWLLQTADCNVEAELVSNLLARKVGKSLALSVRGHRARVLAQRDEFAKKGRSEDQP